MSTVADQARNAFAEPTVRVKQLWILSVFLVQVGVNAAFFGPIQVLLGQQATAFDAMNKEGILATATGVGAFISLFANPLTGALSDRTRSRWGRRRPWVACGVGLVVLGLVLLANAPSVAVMVLGWSSVQLGANAILAAVTAAVPDKVPVGQRGVAGGAVSVAAVVGILGGAVIGAVVGGVFAVGYYICAAVMVLAVVLYLLKGQDAPTDQLPKQPFSLQAFLKGFWISPVRFPDFGWAWVTRFLVQLGVQICIAYLLFFLTDAVRVADPALGVLVLTGLYAIVTLISAIVGGIWSDKVGRRKPFVIVSAIIVSMAALILGFFPTWTGAIIGSLVLGIGNGIYLAVDLALLTQVLPNAESRGKDLGVINIANSLPQVLAGPIAYLFVRHLGGYLWLYFAAGIIGLLGAVFVVRIKGVR